MQLWSNLNYYFSCRIMFLYDLKTPIEYFHSFLEFLAIFPYFSRRLADFYIFLLSSYFIWWSVLDIFQLIILSKFTSVSRIYFERIQTFRGLNWLSRPILCLVEYGSILFELVNFYNVPDISSLVKF